MIPMAIVNHERESRGLEQVCLVEELSKDNSPIIEETESTITRVYSNGRTYAIVTYNKQE